MGQNISMDAKSLKSHPAEEQKEVEKRDPLGSDKDDDSCDSSTDSDMKTNSVRAAIDSLIESCLGGKDSQLDETVKECDHVGKIILSSSPKEESPSGADTVDMFSNFMKDRIADMIRQEDQADEATTCEAPKPDKESGPVVSENQEKKLSVYESLRREDKMPQNTVRLQTLIDKVLDNSLGEDMQNSVPDISSCQVLNKPGTPPVSSRSSTAPQSAPKKAANDSSSMKRSPEIKCLQNRVECLMDHIERVLEKSFVNEEYESTPVISTKNIPSSLENAPRLQTGGSITQGKPITCVANSGCSDSAISVQDIVNRVISQTEVISKLLSPISNAEGSQDESKTAHSEKKVQVVEHSRESERPHQRPLTTSTSGIDQSVETAVDSHSKMRVDHQHHQYHRQQHVHKHADEVSPYQHKNVPVDVAEPKHYYPKGYSVSRYSPLVKQNEALMAQRYGQGVVAPYLNGSLPHAAMLPNAQMYMLRGHPMYMPQRPFPPPLVRADGMLAPEKETPAFPHLPSKTCRCSHCVIYFQFEEKNSKYANVSAASTTAMMQQAEAAALHQSHMQVPIHGPHNQALLAQQDLARIQATSPSKFQNSSVNLANMMQYQAAAAAVHPLKPMPLPAALSQTMPRIGEHFNHEMAKRENEQKQDKIVPQQRPEVYGHGDMAHHSYQKDKIPQRSIENPHAAARPHHHPAGYPPEVSRPTKHSVAPHRNEYNPPHVPVLDLTVKIPESAPIAQPGPSSADRDQPLDLSKKPAASPTVSMSRYIARRDAGGSVQINQMESYNNHHLQHLESSVDKLCHKAQDASHGFVRKDFLDRGSADPNLPMGMMSPGGHKPQLHPIPAPMFSANPNMPALSPIRTTNQGSITRGSPYPNMSQEKLSPKIPISSPSMPQAVVHQLRESPQPLASPQGSDKMDPSQRRGSVSRHEPIQSIIGNHPPNDILYLICRLCRQTYGSPYGFRKHFRNQHGFEPRAEHTIVQTISATKSAMQGPYLIGAPENMQEQHGEVVIPTGRSSAPPERETVPPTGTQFYRSKKESLSPGHPQGMSPSPQSQLEWGGVKPRVYRRASDSRPRSALREDSDDVKYLECQECKQTFQLNDFGSYKRHCRQHHQARAPIPFVGSDAKSSSEQNEKLVNKILTCRFCGGHFQSLIIDEHLKSVHYKELSLEGQHHQQHRKSASSDLSNSNSQELQYQKSRMEAGYPTELQKYLLEPVPNPNLEVQRLPADQITVTASPDSSSDKPAHSDYPQPTSTSQTRSSTSASDTIPDLRYKSTSDKMAESSSSMDTKSKDLSYLHVNVVEDDKDSGFSGDRCSSSESRSLSIESAQDGLSQASPAADPEDPHSGFYRHKKFGGHRKRKESSENQETDSKVPKLDQAGSGKCSASRSSSSSSSASCGKTGKSDSVCDEEGSNESNEKDPQESSTKQETKNKSEETRTKPEETKTKQEARHQLPFVWDRITRIQAGKNIKPPDYMT